MNMNMHIHMYMHTHYIRHLPFQSPVIYDQYSHVFQQGLMPKDPLEFPQLLPSFIQCLLLSCLLGMPSELAFMRYDASNFVGNMRQADINHVFGHRRVAKKQCLNTIKKIITRSGCAYLSVLLIDVASAWTRPSENSDQLLSDVNHVFSDLRVATWNLNTIKNYREIWMHLSVSSLYRRSFSLDQTIRESEQLPSDVNHVFGHLRVATWSLNTNNEIWMHLSISSPYICSFSLDQTIKESDQL